MSVTQIAPFVCLLIGCSWKQFQRACKGEGLDLLALSSAAARERWRLHVAA